MGGNELTHPASVHKRHSRPQLKAALGGEGSLSNSDHSQTEALPVSARSVTFVAYSFRRSSSGSLVKFAAMRLASSCVSRFGRRAVRRINMSGIGGEAEVRGLRLKTLMDR
jgi:hypothetical protein